MGRKMKVFLSLMVLIAVLSGCGSGTKPEDQETGTGSGADVVTITVGTYSPSTGPEGIAMEHFKEYVEEKSGGKIKVDVYHNSQLGDTNTQIEGVSMGSQDIFLCGIDPLSQWVPQIKYCSVNYLFRDEDHLVKFLQSDFFAEGVKALEANNIMFLDDKWTFRQGPFRAIVSRKPINSFEDLKGLRMRVPEVETMQKTWAAYGCAPITVSFSEVYLALEQGMIDAVEVPVSMVAENSYCEVAKYLVKSDTFPQRSALIINKKKFEGLSADLQKALREAAYSAGEVYSKAVQDNFESDLEKLTNELGVTFVDDLDLEPFRKAMESIYKEWEASGYFEPGVVEMIKGL